MSRVKVPRETVRAVFKQTGRFVKPHAEPRLRKQFKKIKEEMMSEFNDHPVTKELDQKTSADPSSFVGNGSLFGFIGFDRSDEPTQIVREMLDSSELKFIKPKIKTCC